MRVYTLITLLILAGMILGILAVLAGIRWAVDRITAAMRYADDNLAEIGDPDQIGEPWGPSRLYLSRRDRRWCRRTGLDLDTETSDR